MGKINSELIKSYLYAKNLVLTDKKHKISKKDHNMKDTDLSNLKITKGDSHMLNKKNQSHNIEQGNLVGDNEPNRDIILPGTKDLKMLGNCVHELNLDMDIDINYSDLIVDKHGTIITSTINRFPYESYYFGKFYVKGKIEFLEGEICWTEYYESGKEIHFKGQLDQVNGKATGRWWFDLSSAKSQYFARKIVGIENYKTIGHISGLFYCSLYTNKLFKWYREWLEHIAIFSQADGVIKSLFTRPEVKEEKI